MGKRREIDRKVEEIEQQLDMLERRPGLRGEVELRAVPSVEDAEIEATRTPENREGDEMTGDEHSRGLQGGDFELADQPNVDSGMPGQETEEENDEARKRAGELPFAESGPPKDI